MKRTLRSLRWRDIKGDTLTVRQALIKAKRGGFRFETPKNHKTRSLGLPADVLEVLGRHKQQQAAERDHAADMGVSWPTHGLVFTSEAGTPLHPDNPKRTLDRLCLAAGVPQVRLHDLRHLHSSVCIAQGVDPKMLADRLGHARASFTLDRYTHLFAEQRQRSAVSLLDFIPDRSQREPN